MSGDEQIVAAGLRTGLFEACAERAIGGIGGRLESQNVKCREHRFKLSREPWRSLFRGPVTQFRGDDDVGADPRFAYLADVIGDTALGVADEVGNDVGIEQVTHQSATGSGA